MKKQLNLAVLSAATASIAATTASAAVLYEANFEAPAFTSGDSVFGQDGWDATDNTWDVIDQLGNNVVSYEVNGVDNNPSNDGQISRTFASQTGDLYFAVDVAFGNAEFVWFNFSDDTDDNNSLGFTSTNDGGPAVRSRGRDGSSVNGGNVSVGNALNTIVLKASKSDPSGNYDTVELFLNPGSTEPLVADSSIVVDTGISALDTFRVRRGGGGVSRAPEVTIDNLRIATTYAEVIPEPASATALSVLGLLSLRRRR